MRVVKMIENNLKLQLEEIFNKYSEIDKVLLFGSRARGDNKYNSEVELCIIGESLSHLTLAKINMDINEIDTHLSFDVLAFNELSKEELIKNIIREGVVIYNGKKAR